MRVLRFQNQTANIIVITVMVIGFIVFLVYGASRFVQKLAMAEKCKNNLRGIGTALFSQSQDEASKSLLVNAAKRKLVGNSDTNPSKQSSFRIPAEQSASMTAALFEVLCVMDRENIPNSLFFCPGRYPDASDGPTRNSIPSLERADTSWGWSTDHWIPYAYDYSVPKDAAPSRIILADRSPENHREHCVNVVFEDLHAATFKTSGWKPYFSGWPTSTGGDRTLTKNGPSPFTTISTHEVSTTPTTDLDATDNIFDNVGDITGTMKPGDEFQVGTGSPRRAFVK